MLLQKMHSLLIFRILLVTVPTNWYEGRTQRNILGQMENVCFWPWQTAALKAGGCIPQSISGLDHICFGRIWQLESSVIQRLCHSSVGISYVCKKKKNFSTFHHLSSPSLCLQKHSSAHCSSVCQSDQTQDRRCKPTICHPLFPCQLTSKGLFKLIAEIFAD